MWFLWRKKYINTRLAHCDFDESKYINTRLTPWDFDENIDKYKAYPLRFEDFVVGRNNKETTKPP